MTIHQVREGLKRDSAARRREKAGLVPAVARKSLKLPADAEKKASVLLEP